MADDHPIMEWKDAWTFEEYVTSFFKKNRTNSDEFKRLLNLYGKEKIKTIWEEYKKMRK